MLDENQKSQASETPEEEILDGAETPKEETPQDVDYKAELEKERTLREKKEKQLGQAEHVIEKLKAEEKSEGIDPQDIEKIVDQRVEAQIQSLTNQVRGDAIDALVEGYSTSPEEAELIKHHLENSIKPSGDDVTDILNAKALANKARFSQQTDEIKRAKMETEANKATSQGEKKTEKPKAKLSPEDQRIMQAYGITSEDLEKGVRG